MQLVSNHTIVKNLERRLVSDATVISVTSAIGRHIIEGLSTIEHNRGAMRSVAGSLSSHRRFNSIGAIQYDAVMTALRAFGLSPDERAVSIDLVEGMDTALAHINVIEDAVVEHDARRVPGYSLIESDVTGRALFEKGSEQLEVYTANRRSLEKVFGVDLIYQNLSRNNIIMLQYKMLEKRTNELGDDDWIYRPDSKLEAQIERMRKFRGEHSPGQFEYRLNAEVFYLKFVKRDAALSNASIFIPVDHFERLRNDPSCRGRHGALIITFERLDGRYLRQTAFLDLIRSGYIGAHAETSSHLRALVEAVIEDNQAVVAAVQSRRTGGGRTAPTVGNLPS